MFEPGTDESVNSLRDKYKVSRIERSILPCSSLYGAKNVGLLVFFHFLSGTSQ